MSALHSSIHAGWSEGRIVQAKDSLAVAARISFNHSAANHSIGNIVAMTALPPDVRPLPAREAAANIAVFNAIPDQAYTARAVK
jgi:hypothetical protein